jgi:hypothetical protein
MFSDVFCLSFCSELLVLVSVSSAAWYIGSGIGWGIATFIVIVAYDFTILSGLGATVEFVVLDVDTGPTLGGGEQLQDVRKSFGSVLGGGELTAVEAFSQGLGRIVSFRAACGAD